MACVTGPIIANKPIPTPLGNEVTLSFDDGAKAEVHGNIDAEYHITFFDSDTGMPLYTNDSLRPNHWCSPSAKYFIPWKIIVRENGTEIINQTINLRGQKVAMLLDSKALGDTIAWMPYAEEFRKRFNCEVHVRTFHNNLFESEYPHLFFEPPGFFPAEPYYAFYKIGCFDTNYSRNKNNWRIITLQNVATDILGLEFKEVRPKIKKSTEPRPIPEKYVCISEFSTMQAKFWNHPGGWQQIVDYLNSVGLKVMSISKEATGLKNVIKMNDRPIEETIRNIQYAEFMITIGCGISWLTWALDVPVVLISGFSRPISEMTDCHRVFNPDVCNGCYNDGDLPFDRGNWSWCPRNNKFECSVSITPDRVKDTIRPLVEKALGQTVLDYTMLPDKYAECRVYTRRDEAGRADDTHVANTILGHDEYRLSKLANCISPPTIIMDVGGHIGTFGMKCKTVWPDANIYAYEPNGISHQLYQKNIAINDMTGVTVYKKGISYEKDRTTLVKDLASTGGDILVTEDMWDRATSKLKIACFNPAASYVLSFENIELSTIEEEMVRNQIDHIDLLKLDCETSEINIVRDMLPETAKKIGMIIGEYHVEGGFATMSRLILEKFPWFEVAHIVPTWYNEAQQGKWDTNWFVGEFFAGPPELVKKWRGAFNGPDYVPPKPPSVPKSHYNIKLVHLLSLPDTPTEMRSIASLSQVEKYGIKYVQHVNGYETELPDLEPFYTTGQWGQPLKPGYYGVWKANKRAVEEEFSEDLDLLIVCERDAILTIPPHEFVLKVRRCLEASIEHCVDYLSFGYKESAYTGILQSHETGHVNDDMYSTNKIIGLHCIAFPRRSREFLLEKFSGEKWYAADIWYNEMFNRNSKHMAIVRERCIQQEDDGVSMIDNALHPDLALQVAGEKRQIKALDKSKRKVMMLCGHLSTGGMPEYAFACVGQLLAQGFKVAVVEWANVAPIYVVQKNKINAIAPVYTLGEDKLLGLQQIIDDFKPDIIHIQEVAEMWMPNDAATWLFRNDRNYNIVETSHSSRFHPEAKVYLPDSFALVNGYHLKGCQALGIPCSVAEYNLAPRVRPDRTTALTSLGLDPKKTHVLSVGLFARWKNQGEVFDVARKMPDVEFHFVGNQAMNFEDYWKPLMNNRPKNCTVWGERDDTDAFYGAMDLLYFASTMEMFPLVVKEGLAWGIPIIMRNLETYCGAYDNNPNIRFIDGDVHKTVNTIRAMFPSLSDGLATAYSACYKSDPKMGIVIPSKFDDHLIRLLDSIIAMQPDWQDTCDIVVGDDGISPECSKKYADMGVRFIPMQQPFNFARNINACVKELDPKGIFMLLNDDIYFNTENFVQITKRIFREGALDPKQRKYAAIGLTVKEGGCSNKYQKLSEFKDTDPALKPSGILAFIGLALTREVWDEVGALDESFEGYGCEDIDWCRRADQLNYGFGVTKLVQITHGFSEDFAASCSFSRVFGQPNVYALWEKSKDVYVAKWGDYSWWGNKG